MSKEAPAQNGGGGIFGFLRGNGTNSAKVQAEQLAVVNPDGGQDDASKEADDGKWGIKAEEKEGYFKMMQKYVGADVTSLVTLPVVIFEPMTMLQKMCELMEYTELLNKADMTDDPIMRMAYSVAWAVSVYPAFERTWKPFNPILGETYEFTHHNNVRFVNEQVSHHPPMSVGHGENEHFEYDCTSKLKTKFLGNSLDVYPVGRTRVTLKRSGHKLDLTPPPTKVHNLIFGRTWVDSPGDMVLTNVTTGEKVVLYFQPCGWFGAGRYEVDGYVYDASEEPRMLITGKWNEFLSCQPCDTEGEPLPDTELTEIWRVKEFPKGDKFQYTQFAHQLNSFTSAPAELLPTDSRLRPDRYYLEKGEMNKSAIEKSRLEEKQRAERKEREKRGETSKPKWFSPTSEVIQTPWGDLEMYEFNGTYREHRARIEKGQSLPPPEVDPEAPEPPSAFDPWQYKDVALSVEVKATEGLVVKD